METETESVEGNARPNVMVSLAAICVLWGQRSLCCLQAEAQRQGAEVDRLRELLARKDAESQQQERALVAANSTVASLQSDLESELVRYLVAFSL